VQLHDDGTLVVSATDLVGFLECDHLVTLEEARARGELEKPFREDPQLDLVRRRGYEHEQRYIERLRNEGRTVVEMRLRDPRTPSDLRAAEAETLAAMHAGTDVIFQATFFDGRWRGHPDFLVRRDDRPSDLGSWSYDIADTKLARRLTVPAVLQMAVYAERLTALQGVPPRELVVVTGDGAERPYRFADGVAYARRLGGELLAFLDRAPVTRPEPVRQCGRCRWQPHCRAEWVVQDHLSLVAGMRTVHADALRAAGLTTVAALAGAREQELPVSLTGPVGTRLKRQARLQLAARGAGPLPYELRDAEPGRGLALLPEPSPGDVFFDIEGDPFVGEHGLEYLFGVVDRGAFTGYWAVSPEQERQAFEALVDHLMAAWERDRDLIALGAYKPGADPVTDDAIARMPALEAFLRQGERAVEPLDETVARLQALVA